MIDERTIMIPLNLHFFDDAEKTEQPTARKRNKARDEGQVAKSQEIGTALLFLSSFFSLRLFAGSIYENLLGLFQFEFQMLPEANNIFESVFMAQYIAYLLQKTLLIVLPIFIVVMVVGIVANLIQVKWHVTWKPLKPKFSRLNPLAGFKRFFSMQILMDLLKSLLKFAVIGIVIYNILKDQITFIPSLMDMELGAAVAFLGDLVVDMGLMVGVMFMFIAAIDYAYTRYKHTKGLKMTKQEVKDEYIQTEGNPQIKGRIKQKMREVSMRRMMQSVPEADVIITNPTHYAVALKYDRMSGKAPILVAKGMDFLAKRIRELAKENDVVIVENPPLARAIYADVEVGDEIPEAMWEAVVEIIAYVFKLKNIV